MTERSSHVYATHVVEIAPEEMITILFAGTDPQYYDGPWSDHDTWIARLNALSQLVGQNSGMDPNDLITFFNDPKKRDHPTNTTCTPNIIAVRQISSDSPVAPNESNISAPPNESKTRATDAPWSSLEAVGEDWSNSTPVERSEIEETAHVMYHLQARPDLLATAGLWMKGTDCNVFFIDACNVYRTQRVSYEDEIGKRLLQAFVWSLYHPRADSSITRNTTKGETTFNIILADKTRYENLHLNLTGSVPGRRTTIFVDPSDPNTVIKEQYVETIRQFFEGDIIKRIHSNGDFPGIVRIKSSEYVKNGDRVVTVSQANSTLLKTRLVMKDRGSLLDTVQTVRELLMVLYDVLEVTRILHRSLNIVHRDISPGNILVADIAHSLDRPAHTGDLAFSESIVNAVEQPTRTRLLLADFESAEDKGYLEAASIRAPEPRAGTPICMARIVRNKHYPRGIYRLPSIPATHESLQSRYQIAYPWRVQTFGQNDEEVVEIPAGSTMPESEFEHLLRYDAESVFWVLTWWAIRAQPANDKRLYLIPHPWWDNLTSKNDLRHENFISSDRRMPVHPTYKPLLNLWDDMREHLKADLKFSKDGTRTHPEYLHEVFQRLILNFLAAHPKRDEEFMDRPKKAEACKSELGGSGGGTFADPAASTSSKYKKATATSPRRSASASLATIYTPDSTSAARQVSNSQVPIDSSEVEARIYGYGKTLEDASSQEALSPHINQMKRTHEQVDVALEESNSGDLEESKAKKARLG